MGFLPCNSFFHRGLWECQWKLEQGCGGAQGELNLPAHLSPGKGAVSERKEINKLIQVGRWWQ